MKMRVRASDALLPVILSILLGAVGCAGVTASSPNNTGPGATLAPSITSQPSSQSVTTGQTATFTVAAAGTAPFSYQWQRNGVAIGGNSPTYTTPSTTSADNGAVFQVMVSNSAGNVMSLPATLTVTAATVAPSITTQPASQTVTAGKTATFSVVATGTAPLSYQWQKNGAAINGATAASYTTPATTTSDNGSTFKVMVTNSAGNITSSSATLTVNAAPVAPSITTQPASQTVTAGKTATFSVVATGTAPLSYQWKKNGSAISGATNASYTTPATASTDNSSTFAVVVTNVAGSITSSSATLTVNPDTTPPTVSITSPAANTTVSGTITVTASASDSVGVSSVQLQVDGANVGSPDTTSPYTFSLDTTALSNASHSLTAVATDTVGNSATSSAVSITVSNQSAGGAQPTYANNGAGCPINTVAGGPTDTVTAYNCPLPNPTGAGNLLVVWVRFLDSTAQTVTFSDNVGGNDYQQAVSCSDVGQNTRSAIYYVQNVKAGLNIVTVHLSPGTMRVELGVYEYYNVATSGALDQAACQAQTSSSLTTTVSSGALPALSATGDLIVHFSHNDNNRAINSCAVGSQSNINWTMRSALVLGPEPVCFQYGIYNSTASVAPEITFNSSNTPSSSISLAAAFKAASAGTPPPSGIRVVYVQHDDGGSTSDTSLSPQLPVSGNLIAELTSSSCNSNTLSSCNYATGLSDGINTWNEVGGATYMSSTNSSQEATGSIWYAPNVQPGVYPLKIAMHPCPGGCAGFPTSWIMYDIAGASATSPLDLQFGGVGNGLASISSNQLNTGSGGPLTSFTVTPSNPNEVILAEVGYEWDTFTDVTAPVGGQFLSAFYTGETNYSWCDLNGGWALYYNGSSTAPETWVWTHDASQFAGVGRGLTLGVAFQQASQ